MSGSCWDFTLVCGPRFLRDFILLPASCVSRSECVGSASQPLKRRLASTPTVHYQANAVALMPALSNGPLYAELRAQVLGKHDLLVSGTPRGKREAQHQ